MIPFGCLRLPEHYGERLWSMLAKSKAHKYVRRVPIPGKTTKTGKPRYRYFYHAAHGGGVGAHEHMVEGAAFRDDDGHWHIKKTDGEKLHIEHDESGKTKTVTRAELASMLEAAHAKDLADYRAKAAARVKEARESGASPKQIAALEEHVRRSGGAVTPPTHATQKPAPAAADSFKSMTLDDDDFADALYSRATDLGLSLSNLGDALAITGNTEAHKDQIKNAGGVWMPRDKEWVVSHRNAGRLYKELTAMDAGKNVPPEVLAGHGLAGNVTAASPSEAAPATAQPAREKPARNRAKPSSGESDNSNPKERGVFKLPDGIMGSIEIFDDGLDEDFDEPETIANMKLLQANMKRDKLDVSALSPEDIFKVSQVLSEIGEWEEGNESDKSSAASKQTIKAINKLSGDLANVAAAKRMTTSLPIGSQVILGGVKSHQWEVVGHEPKDGKIRVRRVGSGDTSGPGTLVNATMAERVDGQQVSPSPAPRFVTGDKPAPAPAVGESAPTGRNTVSLDSITHEWKPRFRTSTGPQYPRMKKDAEGRVFTFHGDPQMSALTASVTLEGKPHPDAANARDRVAKYQAAVAAGYKPKRMQIGGNTALVFEKEGKVLTPAGAAALASGVGTREVVAPAADSVVTGARQQHADAKAITRWAAKLPESTLNNASALMAKFNDSPLSEHFTIKRPAFAEHQVALEPKGGGLSYHAASHEDLFRQLAHIAETGPADYSGGEHWASHRRVAEARARDSRAAGRSLKDVLQGAITKGRRMLSPLTAAFEELTR